MPYELEETGELTRTATVTVPKGDFEKRLNMTLKQMAKDVDLKGFRKGKVPLNVMRQRYGAKVTRDVVEDLVNDHVNELIDDVGRILWLGTPEVTQAPVGDDGDLEFNVDLELRPEVDPIGYLGLEIEKPTYEVSNEDLEQELEALRQKHATTAPVVMRETIAVGDIVTVDFEAISDHPELEQMKGDDVQVEIGSGQALPGIDEALEGAAFDAVVESEIELGGDFPVEELRGEDVPIRLTVKKVERQVLPEIDDDFALQTGEGETLLELRSNLRTKIGEGREEEATRLAEKNLTDKLLEQNEISLPPQFVDQQVDNSAKQRLQMLAQQGLDPEQLGLDIDVFKEDMREDVIRQIKTEFLLVEIAQKEKLEVEEDDLKSFFEEQAESMGVPMQQYIGFIQQNQDMMRQASATVLLNKVREHLLSEATIKDVEWPEPEQAVAPQDLDEDEAEESDVEEESSDEDKSE